MRRFTAFFLLLLLISCLDPYDPDLPDSASNILVVDGFVDARNATATVRLQRSLALQSKEHSPVVQRANVTIHTSEGSAATLHEQQPGTYLASNIPVGPGYKYTLRIVSEDGREYFSDEQTAPETPPIDSITTTIAITGEDLAFRVNTHNNKPASSFYTWDFIETYEYTAPHYSGLVNTPNGPRNRTPEENVYRCWKTDPSKKISIASTRGLSADVVRNFELLTIPRRAVKLSERYSLLVKQRVIDEKEYNYLSLLRKTTESIGGLFDPLPAPVQGNMHSSDDPTETVLGYFRAGNIEEKRFFISFTELPEYFQILPAYDCEIFPTCTKPPPAPGNGITPPCIKIEDIPDYWPLLSQMSSGLSAYYWTYTSEKCGDCRTMGGTTKRPDFW
ncbi:MAG TPA: DUF4249 domain-containing protein [Cyclobacteriaceae bacterium]|nr:DUF4249 domain-containing protein [Cyclobacteriaceae bacterium]